MSSDSILCQHKWLILLVSRIFLLKKMPQSPKWPADVKYTFFQSYVFSIKKTFFCRKKVFSVVSMNTKKVFRAYEVFQNWYFCILRQSDFDTQWMSLLIKNFYNTKRPLKGAVTDVRYFARSKFSRSLVHEKNFSFTWQVVFKLGYVFCQER